MQLLLIAIAVLISACHPRPVEDMVLADVALKSAQKVKADVLAVEQFRQAENFYLRAKKDYTEGYYDSAKKFANESRMMAEQAEYRALVRQNQLKGGGGMEPDPAPPPPSSSRWPNSAPEGSP